MNKYKHIESGNIVLAYQFDANHTLDEIPDWVKETCYIHIESYKIIIGMFCVRHGEYVVKNENHVLLETKASFNKKYEPYITQPSDEMINDFVSYQTDVTANKQLRVNLDKELQTLKELSKSRERSIAITKLQEAIMWLGMDLKRLNEPNPYPDSYNPNNTKINPTSDDLKM